MANTVTVGGQEFRLGKLPALTQYNVLRRLLKPYLAMLKASQTMREATPALNGDENAVIRAFAAAALPIAEVIGTMPDAESDYVIKTCLSVVEIKQSEQVWAPVMGPNGVFMFDLSLPALIGLTVEVVRTFGNFSDIAQQMLVMATP